jgi:hypothetical protein
MATYTNSKGRTFNLGDFGPDGQYLRYAAWYNPFEGKLGETFKQVILARTMRELKEKMENHG